MDYYGSGYNDYRAGGGPSAYHSSYGSQYAGIGRYGPVAPPNFRNAMSRSGATYDGFDRYGYPNATPHNGYNSSQYGGYNHTAEMRPSNYYPNHHAYDSTTTTAAAAAYRNGMVGNGHGTAAAGAASAGPGYSYRDPYANDAAMYRQKSNYIMRGTSYQYPGNREYGYYGYGGAQQAMSPNGANDTPIPPAMHHHNGLVSEYGPHSPTTMPPYQQDANGLPISTGHANATEYPYNGSREFKMARKNQRDKSLSKLVAMNRRLETEVSMMNEAESIDRQMQGYYDANDCVDPAIGYSENYYHELECNTANNGNWPAHTDTDTQATMPRGNQAKANKSNENEDEAPATATTQSPTKNKHSTRSDNQSTEKKKNDNEAEVVPTKRRRKLKHSNSNVSASGREAVRNLMPLPGFQQAFGSTEIGRFSEIFFNAPESPMESLAMFETEMDALSPQPWETGDSLEGPHYNQINGPFTPVYAESYGSTDSPTASSSSYFSDIRSNDF